MRRLARPPASPGQEILDDIALAIPRAAERFATTHPADDDEVVTNMLEILAKLDAAASE